MLEFLICDGRKQGDHTLMVLACDAVEFFNRHTLHRYLIPAGKVVQPDCHIAVEIFLNKNLIDVTAGFDSLKH